MAEDIRTHTAQVRASKATFFGIGWDKRSGLAGFH